MKMTKKSPWARILAVASAAVCAVTATAVGVNFPMAKADAADETYVASLYATASNWVVNYYTCSDDNSVPLTGDGDYTITLSNTGWAATEEWTDFKLVLTQPYDDATKANLYSEENVTINSVTIGDTVYENPGCTVTQSCWTFANGGADGIEWNDDDVYNWSVQYAIDYSAFPTVAVGETIAIDFTIGEGGEETTTTTTETTTATTETTTETTETAAETTVATTETTEPTEETTETTTETAEVTVTTTETAEVTTTTTETTEATTTTTTSTTKATTTTTVTTTAPNYDKEITAFTKLSQVGDDGNVYAYIEFEHQNADSITLVYKVLSNDTNTSGAIGTGGANWGQEDWTNIAVPSDKLVTIEYTVPSYATDTLKASVYWPGVANVQFVSVTLHYDEDPDVTTTTTTNELEGDLTFETITVGEANTQDMMDKCYLRAVIKAPAGRTISYGLYYQPSGGKLVKREVKDAVVDETGLLIVEEEIRNCADCNFEVQWVSNGTATSDTTVQASIETFYEYDASLNGKVNGSDVRAILNYLKGTARTDLQNAVCDVNEDDEVSMADAVTLVKKLIGADSVAKAISE
ncbi:MAG: hypothetical protein IJ496_10930 [Ruminococcus sp.]|nr:hypothetical protein [Ruminococcus sp.]